MHCDLLGVLDEAVARRNLHSDSVHPLHSEDVRDAALQCDEGLQQVNTEGDVKNSMRLTQDHNIHGINPPGHDILPP